MKMKRNNRKGFTLIELLATITILSVVVIIAIPAISSIIKKFNNNYYSMLEGNLKVAGTDYFTDHKTEIPKYTYESSQVDIKDLVSQGYLEKSPKDKNGDSIDGYVLTYKTAKGKYAYQACITTAEYQTEANYCSLEYKIQDNVILVPPSNGVIAIPQTLASYKDRIGSTGHKKLVNIYGATLQTKTDNKNRVLLNEVIAPKQAVVSCKSGANCAGIKGTYTGSATEIENAIKNIITTFIGNPKDEKAYVKKLDELLDKKIKILYTYTENNKSVEALYTVVKAVESVVPSSIQVSLSGVGESLGGVVYTNGEKTPTLNELGWQKNTVVATYSPKEKNETRITDYWCRYENSLYFSCNSEASVKNSTLQVPYRSLNEYIYVYGTTKDGVSTPNEVSYAIKTDSSVPVFTDSNIKINGTKGNNDWYIKNDVVVNANYNGKTGDRATHISGYQIQKNTNGISWDFSQKNVSSYGVLKNLTSSTTPYTYKVKVCTIAGNCSDEVEGKIKVDMNNPAVPTSKVNDKEVNNYNGSWTNTNIKWSDFISSSISGIDHYEYSSNCSGDKSGTLQTIYNYPLNNASRMNSKYCIRAVSKSGNVSSWSEPYIFKIDKVPPVCQTTTNHSNWTNQSVKLTGTCSDNDSGCRKSISKTFDESMNSEESPGEIYDTAGNKTICPTLRVKIDKTPPEIVNVWGYASGGCTTFHAYGSHKAQHRLAITINDSGSGIETVAYKYDYGRDPGSSDSSWEATNTIYLSRSNTIVLSRNSDKNITFLRQDYNLLETGAAYFRFKVCDVAGNCTGVSNSYTASGVSSYKESSNYCRAIYPTGDGFSSTRSNYRNSCSSSGTNCYVIGD